MMTIPNAQDRRCLGTDLLERDRPGKPDDPRRKTTGCSVRWCSAGSELASDRAASVRLGRDNAEKDGRGRGDAKEKKKLGRRVLYALETRKRGVVSFTVIVYNKYILGPKMYAWPFSISLTMIHMTFCSSLAFLLVCVLRLVAPPSSPPVSRTLYLSSILPIGALCSLSLWFSNFAYIYLSISFI
ncbi:hypothetical protein ZIOFF_002204 [Zingiber officinale]|uniref:Uncharacterized protein n=1 Tax=Zingiber officinale TaxID=94328 RepID=A0A8J5M9A7_ZINOF|nr:hypothetical protein ZIOFF_002204 [Zingiber officinale]